jgi:predicted metal-dependent phosphoesterase TrpH
MAGVDLHIHTTFSDSSLTPEEVVAEAVRVGLEAIAITDHDSIDGIQPALESAKQQPLEVIPGVELATLLEGREIHILGYFIDHASSRLGDELRVLKAGRIERAREMVAKLAEHGVNISFDRVLAIAGSGIVARPHIAKAMLEEGLVSSYGEAFSRYIADDSPCAVAKEMLGYAQTIELVTRNAGIPILAHPKDKRTVAAIPELVSCGLAGIEVWHPDHTGEFINYLLDYARKEGLLVTGGSDSHGVKKGKPPIGRFHLPMKLVDDLREGWRSQSSLRDPP